MDAMEILVPGTRIGWDPLKILFVGLIRLVSAGIMTIGYLPQHVGGECMRFYMPAIALGGPYIVLRTC